MAIIFDEVTAQVQPPTPPADRTTPTRREPSPAAITDPLELVRWLERLAERAARLNAD
jgi:hypothetical protein